ncbi:MAG: HAD-IB family hydrolase [Gammaproteobacteria bacterium]|nr:HAD-IB family hydrolase [Gammaproteobacteria bacterium]MDH4256006.1 HAD-IB family hydrolase [Gammaproteobacteria bacterium]MDH5308722.1 HAD-IB family hydrolase [Gammaproteobacteria bacterium]
MKLYEHVTHDVDDSPAGPGTIAFFDMDGTLIFGYSILSIFRESVLTRRLAPGDALRQFFALVSQAVDGTDYGKMLEEAAGLLRGMPEQEFVELGESVFDKYVAASIYPESRALVRAHLARGHTVAIVSSATIYQVAPVARELDIGHQLCNRFQVRNGKFTGSVQRPVCYGTGKLDAARRLAAERGADLPSCFFYTDGLEDLPLLEEVGYPRPLNPDASLESAARRRNWPVRRFSSRGLPGIKEFVRTGLVYGAFMSAALQIIPTWILNQSRRDAVNLAVTTWGEFGSALAGIRIKIRGENYLWERRPAVFLFNHQSAIDVLIIAKLLRRDFTAIAKQEIATNPLVGPVFRVADTVFVDRKNHEKALEALKPVVRTLKQGLSVAIAPEGTRSHGDRLGHFKKGPFHVAMQAKVPIVPIVIHNATDVLPKGGFFVHPTTVYVDVLPPVMTEAWTAESVDQHVEDVRRSYLETLGQHEEPPTQAKIKRVK